MQFYAVLYIIKFMQFFMPLMLSSKIPIKAFIRIRSNMESFIHSEKTVKIITQNNQESEYTFDGVFSHTSTQQNIFNNIKPSLNKFREGFNTTIFCYGNTGAGKTHTMIGTDKDPGLVFNIVKDILKQDIFQMSYMEIYNEKIFDLLETKEVVIRENEGKIVISNLKKKEIKNYAEFKENFKIGNLNRKTAETKLNKTSSRSHSILQIILRNTKLYLIDLAGSENNRKTGNEGIRMVESNNINRSLFVLGQVVNSILNKKIRIPYRDSKLTRLLQDSLGGQSVCYIIANIIDEYEYLEETISTLKFASKSRKIINKGTNMQNREQQRYDLKSLTNIREQRRHEFKSQTNIREQQRHDLKSLTNIREGSYKIKKEGSYKINRDDSILNDKTNKTFKTNKKIKEDSTFIIKSSFYDKPEILLTPNTQEKSYKAFLKRAEKYEKDGNLKKALDDYKTLKKIKDNEKIQEKIEEITEKMKKKKIIKIKITKRELLDILNSGNFLQIKKLKSVGDKRAQSVVDFINSGNFFENLDDLKLIFTEKVISSILASIDL